MTYAKLEILYRCDWPGERKPLWSLLVGLLWGLVTWLAVVMGVGLVTSARNVSKESVLLGLVVAVFVARSRGNLEHFYVELDAECLRWNTWRSGWKDRYQEVTSVGSRA